jgi:hypothetical protein
VYQADLEVVEVIMIIDFLTIAGVAVAMVTVLIMVLLARQ